MAGTTHSAEVHRVAGGEAELGDHRSWRRAVRHREPFEDFLSRLETSFLVEDVVATRLARPVGQVEEVRQRAQQVGGRGSARWRARTAGNVDGGAQLRHARKQWPFVAGGFMHGRTHRTSQVHADRELRIACEHTPSRVRTSI